MERRAILPRFTQAQHPARFQKTPRTTLRQPGVCRILADEGADPTGKFLAALRLVAKAQGLSITQLAHDANLGRQALYRSLSKHGNPELETLTRVLRELGFRLAIQGAA